MMEEKSSSRMSVSTTQYGVIPRRHSFFFNSYSGIQEIEWQSWEELCNIQEQLHRCMQWKFEEALLYIMLLSYKISHTQYVYML